MAHVVGHGHVVSSGGPERDNWSGTLDAGNGTFAKGSSRHPKGQLV